MLRFVAGGLLFNTDGKGNNVDQEQDPGHRGQETNYERALRYSDFNIVGESPLPVYHSISSPSNPLLKDVRKAILRGTLTSEGDCVAESFHLLEEAFRSQSSISALLAAESARGLLESRLQAKPELRVALIPDRVFESVAGTKTSQGVIALVTPGRWRIDQMFTLSSLVLVLDGVQDPGNAGTLVRAAEAFGVSGVIFVKGTASPFHPKTLRASAGSLFRIPYVESVDPVIARAALQRNRLTVFSGMPGGTENAFARANFREPCAFVIGNEGNGVGPEFRSGATAISIPTAGVESLNASIAGAIFLYEAYRQRTA
ncbi:MAG: RNA methyltransferase [Acidobacteriota bacterium]|nr:RNA methyltransferase [Acidobacteriota bacterium]